jgi:mannosyltransferase OCH1-like enzyme
MVSRTLAAPTVSADLVIPRILHQVWLGADPLPDEHARWVETWRANHPDWEHHLWTEENLPDGLLRGEGYERLRHPVERSDILRLELVHRFGGVYVDTDVESLKPIDPLLGGVTFFVERLNSGRISHFVMGAVPGNDALRRAITEMKPRELYGYDKFATGPDYVSTFVDESAGVTIFGAEVFSPRTPAEEREAYAIHHEARSWKDAAGFRHDAEMAERRFKRAQVELDELQQRHREALAELDAARARLAGEAGGALRADLRLLAVRAVRRARAAVRATKRGLRRGAP